MMILNPERVDLNGKPLRGVVAAMIDYQAGRLVEEWGDEGPWAAFVDVPEIKQRVTLVQRLQQTDLDLPRLGDGVEVRMVVAAGASDRGRVGVVIQGVLIEVRHAFSRDGAERRIVIVPVLQTAVGDGVTFGEADGSTVGIDL